MLFVLQDVAVGSRLLLLFGLASKATSFTCLPLLLARVALRIRRRGCICGAGLVCTAHHNHYLATWLSLGEVVYQLGKGATHALFVQLRYLSAHASLTLRAKHIGKLLQRLEQAVRRLVEYHGALLAC